MSEKDRRALRAWYGNMWFFAVMAVLVVFLVIYVMGKLVSG